MQITERWKGMSTNVPTNSILTKSFSNTIRTCGRVRGIFAPAGSYFSSSTIGSEVRLRKFSPTDCGKCSCRVQHCAADIGSAASNISVRNADNVGSKGRCIAIYDETYGSLRLTERLYLNFQHILARLAEAVVSGSDDDEDTLKAVVPRIRREVAKFDAECSS